MKRFFYVLLLFCLAMVLSLQTWAAEKVADGFVGSDVCLACHEKQGQRKSVV